ncbi:MAG: hypothetical protein JW704_11095 [Anaerolineaceae bacterium]|nr:hypothetical protein [Anaerolineaceae bacterium]
MGKEARFGASELLELARAGCRRVKDSRAANASIKLVDALMSGFAMFSLKDSSMLEFDERREKDDNLKRVYGIEKIPSDTQMREILDKTEPGELRPTFKTLVGELEAGGWLEQFLFLGTYYLASLDGTGYFSSKQVHCGNCLEKRNSQTGEVTYSHQMLSGAVVHPDLAVVIPLAPEPIVKQDGSAKNDCERNAGKRFVENLREDYPDLPFIIIEDALSANAPHIEVLKDNHMHFIVGVKPGDHTFLFEYVEQAWQRGEMTDYECRVNGVIHRFQFLNDAPLNASNPEVRVNFIEYWEIDGEKSQHFTWITDLWVTENNVFEIMRGGRARWKIENETFNTLKNQGYNFEHNYGHGHQNLSVVLASLMMLAFLVDQIQQLACGLFQATSRKRLRRSLKAKS